MIASGASLGPYTIVDLLGAGGMGEVYRARDERLGREVAVKVLPPELSADLERLQRFEHEARSAAALNHPNILTVYDVGRHDGAPYLVTELLEGENLRERLRRGGVSAREALGLAVQVARGLAEAHGKGILHRDLKPENLFLTRDGTVKILDFGLAKLTRSEGETEAEAATVSVSLTGAGRVLGTVGYMAPEQVRGLRVDHCADIFAFGCVLYEMLTGRRAFSGPTTADTLSAILREDPPPLASSGAAVTAGLETLIGRCLEKRVEDRFSSAHDLALALEAAQAEVGSAPRVRIAGWARRRVPWAVFAGAAVAAVSAVAVGWLLWWSIGEPASAALDPHLVLVAPFEDLTGDPSLGPVGRMAAEAVGQGLVETGLVRVVAPTGAAAGDGSDEVLGAAARSAGAGLMVTGSSYLTDGRLELRPRLADTASGNLLYSLDPASGPRGDLAGVVEEVRQRVMGAVAVHFDPPVGLGRVVKPPPYPALAEYREGMTASGIDQEDARRHFERAVELAPDFWGAKLRLLMVYDSLHDTERLGSVRSQLLDHLDALSPTERLIFDFYEARVERRHPDALRLVREVRLQVPKDLYFVIAQVLLAKRLNRPREMVECLSGLEPADWEQLNKWPQGEWALSGLAAAYHALGEHEKELEAAERASRVYSRSQGAMQSEVRALAALGQVAEVERIVAVSQRTASESVAAGEVALVASQELRAHGFPDDARRIAAVAADWYASLPGAESESAISRWNRLECLWMAERWDEAAPLVEAFAERELEPRYVVVATGYRGALAARRGDEAAALSADRDLEAVGEGRDLGFALFFRAAIAAQRGDRDTAMERLSSALAHGFGLTDWIHTFFCLEPLHGYPPFEALLAPQG